MRIIHFDNATDYETTNLYIRHDNPNTMLRIYDDTKYVPAVWFAVNRLKRIRHELRNEMKRTLLGY